MYEIPDDAGSQAEESAPRKRKPGRGGLGLILLGGCLLLLAIIQGSLYWVGNQGSPAQMACADLPHPSYDRPVDLSPLLSLDFPPALSLPAYDPTSPPQAFYLGETTLAIQRFPSAEAAADFYFMECSRAPVSSQGGTFEKQWWVSKIVEQTDADGCGSGLYRASAIALNGDTVITIQERDARSPDSPARQQAVDKLAVILQKHLQPGELAGKAGSVALSPGEVLYFDRCAECHSLDGSHGTGPSLQGVYNRQVRLESGESLVADREYLANAILRPSDQTARGYPSGLMPTPSGVVSASVQELVDFIASWR